MGGGHTHPLCTLILPSGTPLIAGTDPRPSSRNEGYRYPYQILQQNDLRTTRSRVVSPFSKAKQKELVWVHVFAELITCHVIGKPTYK